MDIAGIEERLDLIAPIQKPQWGRTLWRDARDLLQEVKRLSAAADDCPRCGHEHTSHTRRGCLIINCDCRD